jgi:hypothetical protein
MNEPNTELLGASPKHGVSSEVGGGPFADRGPPPLVSPPTASESREAARRRVDAIRPPAGLAPRRHEPLRGCQP